MKRIEKLAQAEDRVYTWSVHFVSIPKLGHSTGETPVPHRFWSVPHRFGIDS